MSIHSAMKDYLEVYVNEQYNTGLGFNFTSDDIDGISFITNYAEKDIKKYIRVGADRAYGFSIIITKNYSSNTDDINLLAMESAQAFNEWIDAQNKAKNYPAFGENYTVKKIEALQDMPNLMGTNEDMSKAYYQLQGKVTYYVKF